MYKSNKPNLKDLLFLTWKVIKRYLSTGHLEFSINGVKFILTQHGDLKVVGARIITFNGELLFLGSEPSKEEEELILKEEKRANAETDIEGQGCGSLYREVPLQTALPIRKSHDECEPFCFHRK